MIRRNDLVKIGKFNKPHGVSGEIQLSFTSPLTPLTGALDSPPEGGRGGAFLVCELDNIFVPFRVIESRFISDTTAYVRLKNISSDEAVRPLVNKDVYFDKRATVIAGATANPHHENLTWDYFLDYTLFDKTAGEIGKISAVDDSTPNTLFIVETPDDELLIPANTDFITSIDEKQKQIHLELPEGLLDLT
ncbi:ribosome maturation factor RimM [Bacteroidia bacterium]|nr:ribosome maturation factor RimM [Bacteroidia bacterium]